VYACYRFTTKLREHSDLLDGCIASVVAAATAYTWPCSKTDLPLAWTVEAA